MPATVAVESGAAVARTGTAASVSAASAAKVSWVEWFMVVLPLGIWPATGGGLGRAAVATHLLSMARAVPGAGGNSQRLAATVRTANAGPGARSRPGRLS